MGELNVCFQIDTDNRENFPSGIAFQTFKRQRDTFYEIFRIWEANHLVPGWTFQIALGGKIRSMLTLYNDAINYYHFARLFKSQLLISCIQKGDQTDDIADDSVSFLKTLKDVNPEKLTQLHKRLVTPQRSKDKVEGPPFPGVQEFFKDFILCAFNPVFCAHLENCLIHEILELNDTQFIASEIEDLDTTVDEQTQQNFITCLSSLQLLAKVLGLLVSLPYWSESNNSEAIIATQLEVRTKVSPSLNLHFSLRKAIVLGTLSLTIPWVAKYLAMLDPISLRLPYYKQILELLYHIYKLSVNQSDISISGFSEQTGILLKSTLAWLFELPNVPKDLHSVWQKTSTTGELRTLHQIDKYYMEKSPLSSVETILPVASSKCSLDKLHIINDKVLRACCPSAVSNMPVTNANYNSNKHIKPVSSKLYKSGGSAGTKHLELQLEEAFFHGQPASTRKTVEFVSERIASTCVKHICNTLLTTSRETNLNTFRKILKKKHTEIQSKTTEEPGSNEITEFKQLQALVLNDMNVLATNTSKEVTEQCEAIIPTICETRVAKSIESLLAEDSLSPVKEMCIKIATRLATERIHQWIQSHMVGASLFITDMELEISRFLRNPGPLNGYQEKKHNPEAVSPTEVIDELRAFIWEILENSGKSLTLTSVSSALNNLYQTLNERADLMLGPEKLLYSLSTDFALFLVAYRMDLFTPTIQEKFVKVWALDRCKLSESDNPIERILSPRNVMLLAQPEKDDVWQLFGKFLKKLLDQNVLTIESLSDQSVALLRQDWPVTVLKHLSKCLTEAIADLKACDETTEKVKYLLGWIAETYHEIEFYNPV